jgi:Fur family ferric uptake transcriptional regulator
VSARRLVRLGGDVASSPEQRFEEYLQLRGMRNTAQRRMLLEHVFSKHDHFDAEQLMQRLPRKGQKGYISRPTVYRTLAEFGVSKRGLDARAR